MSEEYWQELGRRAVACKAWRWMPGMLDGLSEQRVARLRYGLIMMERDGTGEADAFDPGRAKIWPDLRDPATLGCLLALVREAWDSPYAATAWLRGCGWSLHLNFDSSHPRLQEWPSHYATEAAALVAALEAAP